MCGGQRARAHNGCRAQRGAAAPRPRGREDTVADETIAPPPGGHTPRTHRAARPPARTGRPCGCGMHHGHESSDHGLARSAEGVGDMRAWVGRISIGAGIMALLLAGPASAGQWRPQGPAGGPAGLIAVDPTDALTAYVASGDGIYKTVDGGERWLPLDVGARQGL